ncbi:PH domain-containing protein [Pelagicoccus sp. SDUM812002]|uniref:PH domain-containing protein n=1 Tax=Pelagicoccus sp. SDUM812002 TaxID=3041266 RepID=UPI0028103FCE|nr:PH domain-containing protein [Pelagicoccus sp. SDUM812002]MDQ8186681.1 PH domain-containing protein [Pelagicoccus sp. SDUM812002]
MSLPEAIPSKDTGWQRLSSVSIAYFVIKFTISLLRNAIQSIIPGIAAISFFADNKVLWFSVALPAAFLLITVYSFFYYWYFKFKTHEGEILIHQGVFKKELLNLDFDRIQNVNIIRPFYFAPFKVVNCIVESAGSNAAEIELPGVKEAFAIDTRTRVFEAEKPKEERDDEENEVSKSPDSSMACRKLSNWEMAKSGLTSYFAFVALAALAPFSDRIFSFLFEYVYSGILAPFESIPILKAFVITVLIFLTAALLLLTLIAGSVVGALIQNYNYELHDNNDRLVRLTGLFERKSTTLKKSKVQSIVITQNLAEKILGRVRLQYRQVGTSNETKSDSHVQVPILKPDASGTFASIVFPDCPQPGFTKIHHSYVKRVFLYFWVLPLTIIVSIPSILISELFLFGLVLLIPGLLAVMLRYRRFGYWFTGEYGAIREGFIGNKTTIFPIRKTQTVRIAQSRGQRIRNLGNLTIQLGSGPVTIPYLPMSNLSEIVDKTLYKTESSSEPWM